MCPTCIHSPSICIHQTFITQVAVGLGLPWWLRGKASACNAGDPGLIPGSGRSPGEGNGNPLQYCSLENSVGYNPWGRKESDTSDRLHFHFSLSVGLKAIDFIDGDD